MTVPWRRSAGVPPTSGPQLAELPSTQRRTTDSRFQNRAREGERMSLSAPVHSEAPVTALAYLDVIVIAVATPIMLLIGVPAIGYLVGAGAWIVLRVAGVGVERVAGSLAD